MVLIHMAPHVFHVPWFWHITWTTCISRATMPHSGSECSLVAVSAPWWWWVLPGGDEGSLVVVRAPWWRWGPPDGGEGFYSDSWPQCFTACVKFFALMEGNIMVLLLKTHPFTFPTIISHLQVSDSYLWNMLCYTSSHIHTVTMWVPFHL